MILLGIGILIFICGYIANGLLSANTRAETYELELVYGAKKELEEENKRLKRDNEILKRELNKQIDEKAELIYGGGK